MGRGECVNENLFCGYAYVCTFDCVCEYGCVGECMPVCTQTHTHTQNAVCIGEMVHCLIVFVCTLLCVSKCLIVACMSSYLDVHVSLCVLSEFLSV